jgi:hypothetical protein
VVEVPDASQVESTFDRVLRQLDGITTISVIRYLFLSVETEEAIRPRISPHGLVGITIFVDEDPFHRKCQAREKAWRHGHTVAYEDSDGALVSV